MLEMTHDKNIQKGTVEQACMYYIQWSTLVVIPTSVVYRLPGSGSPSCRYTRHSDCPVVPRLCSPSKTQVDQHFLA